MIQNITVLFSGDQQDSSDRVGRILLAEMASCQLEYKFLAYITGRETFFRKVINHLQRFLIHLRPLQGGRDQFFDAREPVGQWIMEYNMGSTFWQASQRSVHSIQILDFSHI
jgi:hypothetical protein